MEEKKENSILGTSVKILKTVSKFGISTVLGNLMMVGMPPHIKWPLKVAIGIGTTLMGYMVTDMAEDFIDRKVEEIKTEIKEAMDMVNPEAAPAKTE